ncbi:MAG: hypothetical protein AAGJ81_04450 [Verrucomicrobiota bacterium]
MRGVILLLFLPAILLGKAKSVVELENLDGAIIEAEIISVVEVERQGSFLCFRKPDSKHIFLYPFTSLSKASLAHLSSLHTRGNGSKFLVADGVTGRQLDVIEEYLDAEPRERLVIELRELRKKESFLAREWKRLQQQTFQLQQSLAGARTPEQRARIRPLFQESLRARDRTGKQLVLVQRDIARLEERIALLKSIGVDIPDDPFAD